VTVLEARITDLSYAPEIAEAMLRRQQASAIVAARAKIVEGAVLMVREAVAQLEEGRPTWMRSRWMRTARPPSPRT
jgi:hypothetical protein